MTKRKNIANKSRVIDIMRALSEAPLDELPELARDGYEQDISLNVTHPINELEGIAAGLRQLWLPLRRSLPDMERRDHFVAGGRYRDADWIACMGHYMGSFERDLLGIPATRGVVCLRYCEGHELRDGKIATSYIFIDFLDLMRQAGYVPIAPSLGSEMRWMPPRTLDGVILSPQDEASLQEDDRDDSQDARRPGLLQWGAADARRARRDGTGQALAQEFHVVWTVGHRQHPWLEGISKTIIRFLFWWLFPTEADLNRGISYALATVILP